MALKAVAGGTGRVREGVRTQGGAATPPAPPPAGGIPATALVLNAQAVTLNGQNITKAA